MASGQPSETSSEFHAFRKHRHDVLNELQIVRGYLQLGRPENAIRILDRIASWFQSLTALQSALQLGDYPDRERLLWVAAGLPHVHFVPGDADSLPQTFDVNGVVACWTWLEEQGTDAGFASIPVRLVHSVNSSSLICLIQGTEEILRWWNTDLARQDLRFGEIVLQCEDSFQA